MAKQRTQKYTPWLFKGSPIMNEDVQEDWVGFIYLIRLKTESGELFYVGKKNFGTNAKVKLGKKEMPTDKRLKTYKRKFNFTFENYISSSEEVVRLINVGCPYERIILQICKTKGALTYHEVRWLMKFRALERTDFLNNNILGSLYRKHFFS